MSSPVNDEQHDKRYMYAPPWARETAKEPPEAIVEAIERRRLERQRKGASPDDAVDKSAGNEGSNEPPLAAAGPADLEQAMADAIRASKWTPRSLDPVVMPEPPKPRLDGPTWGMVVRLGGAVVAAAVAALFVTGAVRLPGIDISLGAREGATASSAVAQARAGNVLLQRQPIVVADASPSLPPAADTAAAPPPPTPTPVQPEVVPQASAAPSRPPPEVLTAYASLDAQPAETSLKSKGDNVQVPPAATPKLGEVRALDRDELAGLVRRGQALLNEGDIASARLLLRRAAEAGDANAALMLAGSYDRAELARLKVIGVAPDYAQAKLWYTKAVEHGSAEAARRLQQLAQRGD